MLVQFRFQNYKSFRDDTILDLTVLDKDGYKDHVIPMGQEQILPTAIIYGANASGKSNVLQAFRYMCTYVRKSWGYGGEDEENRRTITNFPTPFLFDETSREATSEFEVYFITNEEGISKYYQYGFSVSHEGVQEEWLYDMPLETDGDCVKIFDRDGEELDLSGLPSECHNNIRTALQKETLIVSLGTKLKIMPLKRVSDWFRQQVFANFGKPIENLLLSQMLPPDFEDDTVVQNQVVHYLAAFDPSIVSFVVEKQKKDEDSKDEYSVKTRHRMINSDKTVDIPLRSESTGTLKMFALYPMLQNVLKNGSVLVIDELDSQLHPLLLRTLLQTFLKAELNPNHAQIIGTTHDSWLMRSGILRRDEIWFTEKAPDGVSSLYSLAAYPKSDNASDDEQYLFGEYGAIPYMRPLFDKGE